jgi:C4-dicarboxylate-specific signal transduction histidine kinase
LYPDPKSRKINRSSLLENNLTTDAFTPNRIEVLNLLTAQAAISIENARLYGQLEDYSRNLEAKVEQRTQELQANNLQLQQTLKQLQRTQAQLIQTEKMSSLGQMVAGMAHEINNPITFIAGNIDHAREYVQDLLELIDVYADNLPDANAAIEEKIEEIELEYLRRRFAQTV